MCCTGDTAGEQCTPAGLAVFLSLRLQECGLHAGGAIQTDYTTLFQEDEAFTVSDMHASELIVLAPMVETMKLHAKSEDPDTLIRGEDLLRDITSLTMRRLRVQERGEVVLKAYPDSAMWVFKQGTSSTRAIGALIIALPV